MAPGVGLLVEYSRILDTFQFRHPKRQAINAWLGIVVGAANGHHITVGQADDVGAEQGAVVGAGVVGGIEQAIQLGAIQQCFTVVAIRVGAGVQGRGFDPGWIVVFIQRQNAGLIVDGHFAKFRNNG